MEVEQDLKGNKGFSPFSEGFFFFFKLDKNSSEVVSVQMGDAAGGVKTPL